MVWTESSTTTPAAYQQTRLMPAGVWGGVSLSLLTAHEWRRFGTSQAGP